MKNKDLVFHNPPQVFDPSPFGFSHSIGVSSPLKICYISGQSGGTCKNHALAADFRTQVTDGLSNLKIVLNDHKMTLTDVVKITVLIADYNAEKLAVWSEEAKKVWQSTGLPTSTLIPVSQLALADMLFEIDAIAIQKI